MLGDLVLHDDDDLVPLPNLNAAIQKGHSLVHPPQG
jgi:hypothetical protein